MEVRVLLFGPHAALAGRESVVVTLGEDVSCRAIRLGLEEGLPSLRGLLPLSRFAVNGVFVPQEHLVKPSDEVAVIGLVSGG